MTTKELIEELQRDDQDRKVRIVCKMQGDNPTYSPQEVRFEIDRIVMTPEPTIILIKK